MYEHCVTQLPRVPSDDKRARYLSAIKKNTDHPVSPESPHAYDIFAVPANFATKFSSNDCQVRSYSPFY